MDQAEIDEVVALTGEFGLVGLSSDQIGKLARLVAKIRGEPKKAGRPRITSRKAKSRHNFEPAKMPDHPPEIVKGTGWRIR